MAEFAELGLRNSAAGEYWDEKEYIIFYEEQTLNATLL